MHQVVTAVTRSREIDSKVVQSCTVGFIAFIDNLSHQKIEQFFVFIYLCSSIYKNLRMRQVIRKKVVDKTKHIINI